MLLSSVPLPPSCSRSGGAPTSLLRPLSCAAAHRIALGVGAVALAVLSGCGGPQRGGASEACVAPSDARSASALTQDAACWRAGETSEASLAACRLADTVATRLSPEAAADFAVCVVRAGERSDGAWLGNYLAQLDSAAIVAVADAMGEVFDAQTQSNSLAATLDEAAQRAIAAALPTLRAESRQVFVSLASRYQLDPLIGSVGPYVRELDASDPGLAGFAESQLAAGGSLSEDTMWAAAVSGVWTAEDLFNCHSGADERCASWSGASPILLMGEPGVAPGRSTDPQRAVEMISGGAASAEEAGALTRFVTNASYANRGGMLNFLIGQMTDPRIDEAVRVAIATNASEEMCAMGMVLETMLRARADVGILEDAMKPWPQFLAHCDATYWAPSSMGSAVASGSMLGAPLEMYEGFRSRVASAFSEASCEEALSAADAFAAEVGNRAAQRGLIYVVLSEATGARCDETFRPAITSLSRRDGEHPESRILALAWREARGDGSACSEIDAAMNWYDEDYREGPSAWSEAWASSLRRACR